MTTTTTASAMTTTTAASAMTTTATATPSADIEEHNSLSWTLSDLSR